MEGDEQKDARHCRMEMMAGQILRRGRKLEAVSNQFWKCTDDTNAFHEHHYLLWQLILEYHFMKEYPEIHFKRKKRILAHFHTVSRQHQRTLDMDIFLQWNIKYTIVTDSSNTMYVLW